MRGSTATSDTNSWLYSTSGTRISRMSKVITIANTPSLKTSTRFLFIGVLLRFSCRHRRAALALDQVLACCYQCGIHPWIGCGMPDATHEHQLAVWPHRCQLPGRYERTSHIHAPMHQDPRVAPA